MTPLATQLKAEIEASGPISVERYMTACAAHYYATRDPFGDGGDFTTAPEISQMFGELIGAWLADIWQRAGSPERVNLVELGPGRGTLMADLLRAAATLPPFANALSVHFVETSPILRASQSRLVPDATFHDDLAGVTGGVPMLLVANEFFDALPIAQWVGTNDGWKTRVVNCQDDAFVFEDGDTAAIAPPCTVGAIVEHSPAAARIVKSIGERLAKDGGAALIIDYGYAEPATTETLQALAGHKPVHPLDTPGEADLTAHVNFTALATAARAGGAEPSKLTSQGAFLAALGITQRAEMLSRNIDPAKRHLVTSAMRRLIAPQAMGELFKVMALRSPDWPEPAGIAT